MFTSIPSLDSVVQSLLPAFVVPNMLLVTSRSPSERRAAWELGLAGDAVIREIKLDATFDKVLQQATTGEEKGTFYFSRIRRTGTIGLCQEHRELPKAGTCIT